MSQVSDRFLRYVSVDTQSKEDQEEFPSTAKQKDLGKLLAGELEEMGATRVRMDPHGYVYAQIPSNIPETVPSLGFIAHMDTSPACSGKEVKAQVICGYGGGPVTLNREARIIMSPDDYPELSEYIGQDLITTDGTTLLGADDKAGVAEIMTMAAHLLAHPELPHGKICIGFTPDEEVGRGADFFDVEGFNADVAYTVDGGALGELEYENFNAATARVAVHGVSIHPGSARGKMKNALLMAMEFHGLLPAFENPACTDGYEGFYHLDSLSGGVELARMKYLIRDHDKGKFQDRKRRMEETAAFINGKYGDGAVELTIQDSYYNMQEKIEDHFYLVETAKDAMTELGITPKICPIRGGTDGARLSYQGLPCPNLCTGGHNFHGRFEYVSIQSMEKIVGLLVKITEKFAKMV